MLMLFYIMYHIPSWKVDGDPCHCIEETVIAVEHLNEVEHPSEYYVNRVKLLTTDLFKFFCAIVPFLVGRLCMRRIGYKFSVTLQLAGLM